MIKPKRIREMVKASLFEPAELVNGKPPSGVNFILVEGLVRKFGFHKGRLERQRAELIEMIRELDGKFLPLEEGGGDGWSFLSLPFDRDGSQWGEQPDAEELLCLALGLKLAKIQLPRDMWDVLPGGMPYVLLSTKGLEK